MITSLPMQNQLDLAVPHAHENLPERGSQDAFARLGAGLRMIPRQLQVSAQREYPLPFRLAQQRGHTVPCSGQFGLEPDHRSKAFVPAPLQFGGNESVVGVHSMVLALCVPDFEAGLLQSEFDLTLLLFAQVAVRFNSLQRCLYAEWCDDLQELGSHCLINTPRAERDALVAFACVVPSATQIAGIYVPSSPVSHNELAAAVATAQ